MGFSFDFTIVPIPIVPILLTKLINICTESLVGVILHTSIGNQWSESNQHNNMPGG